MKVPSLSRGCEIAQFFVRYMVCIVLVRLPLSLWMWLYYNPTVMFPHWKQAHSHRLYAYLSTLTNAYGFFLAYDAYVLWQLYKPKATQSVSWRATRECATQTP
jgi:hypothetical protein